MKHLGLKPKLSEAEYLSGHDSSAPLSARFLGRESIKANRKLKSNKSFTLIELIFEITVLGLLVIPTAILLVQLALSIIQTDTNSTATALAIQQAEKAMWNYSFANVGNADTGGNFIAFLAPYQRYSYQVEVRCVEAGNLDSPVVCPGTNSYKIIRVFVANSSMPNFVEINILLSKL